MSWADLPVGMRALLALTVLLLGAELIVGLAFIVGIPWKVDPGVATLTGAIVGLAIVAWQARLGFGNLIKSQENQARIEREGREHQLGLDEQKAERSVQHDRRVLLAALRAEMISLWHQAQKARQWAAILSIMYEGMEKEKAPSSTTEIKTAQFEAPVFRANIEKLGLLGASLASDVILALALAKPSEPIKMATPMSFETLKGIYKGIESGMEEWCADLDHVAYRLRAEAENLPDPGTLSQARAKREANKKAQQ